MVWVAGAGGRCSLRGRACTSEAARARPEGCWASTGSDDNPALGKTRAVSPWPHCLVGSLYCPLGTRLKILPTGKGEMFYSLGPVSKSGFIAERQPGDNKS